MDKKYDVLINCKNGIVLKSLWYKRNKSREDVMMLEENKTVCFTCTETINR